MTPVKTSLLRSSPSGRGGRPGRGTGPVKGALGALSVAVTLAGWAVLSAGQEQDGAAAPTAATGEGPGQVGVAVELPPVPTVVPLPDLLVPTSSVVGAAPPEATNRAVEAPPPPPPPPRARIRTRSSR